MKESIPEWKLFEEGYLKQKNDDLTEPLGGKNPKLQIESLFDENDQFKFQGFKPVPKRVFWKQNEDDPSGEEQGPDEDEDEWDREEDDMDKYFEDIGRRENEERLEDVNQKPLFHEMKEISKTDWYKTIEMDDDEVEIQQDDEDDSKDKGLDWIMEAVEK